MSGNVVGTVGTGVGVGSCGGPQALDAIMNATTNAIRSGAEAALARVCIEKLSFDVLSGVVVCVQTATVTACGGD